MPSSSNRGWLLAALAAALFLPLFRWLRLGPLDFWWWMSANQLILLAAAYGTNAAARCALAADLRANVLRKIWLGLLAAALLYGIFWLGNLLARALFSFAAGGIASVYGFKSGTSVVRVGLLIGLLIGPGEELIWRGAIQRALTERLGSVRGLLVATVLYAAVHLSSGNPMLILAALVCGFFWGYLYQRTGSLLLVIISHTAWDLTVFLFLPFS